MSNGAPDTGQGIDVGDAVFTFLSNTTNLEQGFDRVATVSEQTIAKATANFSQLGGAIDATSDSMAVGANGAVKLGEVTTLAGEKAKFSMYEARGEAGLLGEMFGIHLPRHVRSFVAELPGVGTALSAAFTATAVLFLLDALVKGTEKLSEWVSETFIFTEAMKKSDEAIKEQNKTLLELADQLEKDAKALERFGKTQSEIKSDKVVELRNEIAKNKTVFEAAAKAARDYATGANASVDDQVLQKTEQLGGFLGTVANAYVRIALGEKHVFDSIEAFFTGSKTPGQIAAEAEEAGQKAQAVATETAKKLADEKKQISLAEKEVAAQAIADQEEAGKKLIAIGETVGAARIRQWTAQASYATRFAEDEALAVLQVKREAAEKEYQLKLQTLERERALEQKSASGYESIGDEAAAAKQGQLVKETNAKIEVLQADHIVKSAELQKAANDEYTAAAEHAAQKALDVQLAAIEKFKSEQLALYVDGKAGLASWESAQIHATEAAAIAHEAYLKRIIAVYHQQGDAQKEQESQQKLATLDIETQAKATEKLSGAMKQLASATKEAKDAEQKLAEDRISEHFADQERAIVRLAEMGLITEKQKNDRLQLLESQQAAAALKILDQSLKAQQALRDAAQAKLDAASANPSTNKSELVTLQAELQKEVAAVAKAEDEKLKAQERYNKQSETNDKSHYARALQLAIANDNQLLAERLKENHAALLTEQQNLNLAKSRGEDTSAIQRNIAAMSRKEQLLEKEAEGDKKVIAEQLKLHQAELAGAQSALLDAKARGTVVTAINQQIAALEKLIAEEQKEEKQVHKTQSVWDVFSADFKKRAKEDGTAAQQMGQLAADAAMQIQKAFESALGAAILGEKGIGAALEKATAQILAQIAVQAAVKSLYNLAEGLAAAANPFTAWMAPGYFTAAAEFAVAAGAAGGTAAAISGATGGSSGSGSSQGNSVSSSSNPSGVQQTTSAGGGSHQTVTTTGLAEGGVVSKPTMLTPDVMVGDSKSGGAAEEAVLPLSDPDAMRKVAKAIMPGGISSPGEPSSFDADSLKRMTEAISSLISTRDQAREFKFGESGTGSNPVFGFAGSTVGQALGFDRSAGSTSDKSEFTPGGAPDDATMAAVVSAGRSDASPSYRPDFAPSRTPSQSDKSDFHFAPAVPTAREASGFTSGEPAPGEKPAFTRGGDPSEAEKADFLSAQPSISQQPGFDRGSPTVGEALGFKFDTPYPGDKPVFSSGTPSAPGRRGFSLAAPSASEQRDFEASSPQTVGEALGFGFSRPEPSYAGLGFTSGQPSTATKPGFSSGAPSPHEKEEMEFGQPSAGERPGYTFSAPSLPREMPDVQSLAASFGGLLTQPTLRAASNAQVPAAAVSASSAAQPPVDVEARMERFAAKMSGQTQPEGRSSGGNLGGDTTHIHVNVKGSVDHGTIAGLVKKISKKVQNRQVTLKASDSLRVTRRSQ